MKKIKLFILIHLVATSFVAKAQLNLDCDAAMPFCTGTAAVFDAESNVGTANPGPDYGCLATQLNPSWYYMEIATGGNLDVTITNSQNQDLDFVLWGPFANQITPCTASLTAGNIVDCGNGTTSTENMNIAGAIAGEFYILLITNPSNTATLISFVEDGTTTATTNCGITCPPIDWGVYNTTTGTVDQSFNFSCTDGPVQFRADQDGFTIRQSITPTNEVDIIPVNDMAGNTIEVLQNGTSIGTLTAPPSSGLTKSYYMVMKRYSDPAAIQSYILDELLIGADMVYKAKDFHSRALLDSGIWVSDGNPQTVTVTPPPNLSGEAKWSVSPAAGIPGFVFVGDDGIAVFDPSKVPPGSYDVTYSWDNEMGNCSGDSTHTIIVSSPYTATSLSYTTPVCEATGGTISPTLVGDAGGTYTSTSGLVINNSTGVINLSISTPNTYTVTYLVGTPLPSSCNASITTTVTILPDVSPVWTNPGTICEKAGSINLNSLITGTTGGSWSGTGVSGNMFNPTGLNGNIAVTYTVGTSPCEEDLTQNIEVEPIVDPTWSNPGSVCENSGSINLNSLITGTTGGSWSGTGVSSNTFNPTGLSGNIAVTYLVGVAPCKDSLTLSIQVDGVDDPSFNYSTGTFCLTGSDPAPTITGVTGGVFTITSPGVIAGNGTIDLNSSGTGIFTVTYSTVPAGNPCPDSTTVVITITSAPSATFNYDAAQYCENGTPNPVLTFGVGASPGVFTATPSGLSINSSTGEIDLTLSTPGIYTVFNDIAAAGGCSSASSSTTIEILDLDDANFTYPSPTFCLTDTNPLPTVTGLSGGTYTINNGGVINLTTGEIDITASGSGSYVVTYTTSGACPNTETFNVLLTTGSDATITQEGPFCNGDPSVTLIGVDGGGTWSGSGVTNGVFDPSLAGVGTHEITYTIPGSCGDTDTMTIIVTGVEAIINASPLTGAPPLEVVFGNGSSLPATYFWDFGDGNTSNLFEPVNNYTANGTYLVSLTVTEGNCTDSTSVTITVIGEPFILIPNVFTPNGDKKNDVFTVESENIETIEGVIYNRWGQLMFSWDHLDGFWDGTTFSGSEAPDGTYFYIIKAKDFKAKEYLKKGGLTLIR